MWWFHAKFQQYPMDIFHHNIAFTTEYKRTIHFVRFSHQLFANVQCIHGTICREKCRGNDSSHIIPSGISLTSKGNNNLFAKVPYVLEDEIGVVRHLFCYASELWKLKCKSICHFTVAVTTCHWNEQCFLVIAFLFLFFSVDANYIRHCSLFFFQCASDLHEHISETLIEVRK